MTDLIEAPGGENTDEEHGFWAILEIMGHRKHVGLVREVEQFGAKACRIDLYRGDEPVA